MSERPRPFTRRTPVSAAFVSTFLALGLVTKLAPEPPPAPPQTDPDKPVAARPVAIRRMPAGYLAAGCGRSGRPHPYRPRIPQTEADQACLAAAEARRERRRERRRARLAPLRSAA